MIKMIYDPIMSVRYITEDPEPHTEPQRVVRAKIQEQYNRTRHARAKQLRHIKNTKAK